MKTYVDIPLVYDSHICFAMCKFFISEDMHYMNYHIPENNKRY